MLSLQFVVVKIFTDKSRLHLKPPILPHYGASKEKRFAPAMSSWLESWCAIGNSPSDLALCR